MPLNITTRNFSVDDITDDQTNEDENGVPQDSTNAGAALTNVQVDQNFINIKHLVDANAARIDVSHDSDGNIKNLVIEADDLKPNSVDYSKLKSIHYAAVVDSAWTASGGTSVNDTEPNKMLVKVDSLTELKTGMLFFVRAKVANTVGVTLTLSNLINEISTDLATDIQIVKGPFTTAGAGLPLIAGDIRVGQVAALLYDGTSFQLTNPTRPLVAFVANPTVQQENTDPTAVVNTAAIVELLTKLKAAGIMATS